jgi:ABC-2 type transport system permease protein
VGNSVFVDAQPLIEQFSLIGRLGDLQRGLFDLSDILYYVTLSSLFIFLTVQVLARKRWN